MKKAFTLAEVLITLGVIGIVAQATIPTLVSSYRDQVTVTKLKKFMSMYEQGVKTLIVNEGCQDVVCTGAFYNYEDRVAAYPGWLPIINEKFKTVFKGLETSVDVGYIHAKPIKQLRGTLQGWNDFASGFVFKTPDGVIVWMGRGPCVASASNITNFKRRCAWALVDVNGDDRPNQYGRDVFSFYTTDDGRFLPDYSEQYAKFESGSSWAGSMNYWKNSAACSTTSNYGDGCISRIIEDGWKINY